MKIKIADLIPGKLYHFEANSSLFDDKIGMFIEIKRIFHKGFMEGDYFIILCETSIEKLHMIFYNIHELT